MLRNLRRSVGRQLAIVAVLGGLAVWGADAALRVLLVLGASGAVGVPVALGGARLDALGGRVELDAFRLGNPAGFAGPAFLRVGDMQLRVDRDSFRGEALEIPLIALNGVSLHIERRGGHTNAGAILGRLRHLGGGADAWTGRRVTVGRLEVRDCIAHVVFAPGLGARGETYVELAPVVVTGLGSRGEGLTLAELSHRVVEQLVSLALLEVARSGTAPVPPAMRRELQARLARVERLQPVDEGVDVADSGGPRPH